MPWIRGLRRDCQWSATVDDVSDERAAAPTDRKRQERGRRRIESILDAAELVISEVGCDAANMSLIASRAEISPGSLYQFFAAKAELVEALAQRYVDHLGATEWPVDLAWTTQSVSDSVDLIVDPILAFHLTHPEVNALLGDSSPRVQLQQIWAQLKP